MKFDNDLKTLIIGLVAMIVAKVTGLSDACSNEVSSTLIYVGIPVIVGAVVWFNKAVLRKETTLSGRVIAK